MNTGIFLLFSIFIASPTFGKILNLVIELTPPFSLFITPSLSRNTADTLFLFLFFCSILIFFNLLGVPKSLMYSIDLYP